MIVVFYSVLQRNNGLGAKMKQSDYLKWGVAQEWRISLCTSGFLSPHADRHAGDISFTVYNFVCLFVCMSAKNFVTRLLFKDVLICHTISKHRLSFVVVLMLDCQCYKVFELYTEYFLFCIWNKLHKYLVFSEWSQKYFRYNFQKYFVFCIKYTAKKYLLQLWWRRSACGDIRQSKDLTTTGVVKSFESLFSQRRRLEFESGSVVD